MSDEPQETETPAAPESADDGALFASLEQQPERLETANSRQTDTVDEVTPDPARLELVFDVPVRLSIELGRTELPIREVVGLSRGSIVELDRSPGTPLDVRVNGVLIGRGEIVLVNEERLGLRFIEVVNNADRTKRTG